MFQKSALPGSPYSPTLLFSLLASQKTDLVHVFNTIFNVFMCIVLSLGQYSKCLHLFAVSRVMPLFLFKGGIFSSTKTAKCEVNPNTACMAHTDWGPRPWLYTDISYQHTEEWSPPSVLYQRIYYSHRKNSERCVKPSGGGAVNLWDCYNWIMLCLLWHLTKCDWLWQALEGPRQCFL